MKEIYVNTMQREALEVQANVTVIVAGRGTGKGLVQAGFCLLAASLMPGCTIGYIAKDGNYAMTNTIPSMTMHFPSMGFHEGLHWCMGVRPPRNMGWKEPVVKPERYETVMSFWNGSVMQVVSQARLGSSNSKSFDFLLIDEAKFIDFERMKKETFQANRGQVNLFGNCHLHHGMLITTDLSEDPKRSWFLRYEKMCREDVVDCIKGLLAEKAFLTESAKTDDGAKYRLNSVDKMLGNLRRNAILFRRYSSLVNLEVLGEEFVKQQLRDLTPLTFQTSILCKEVEGSPHGFYSNLRPTNIYDGKERGKYDDCRKDCDLDERLPLCIAFDFNANINCMCVGQANSEEGRMNTVKSFYVKYQRKLPGLLEDFCRYYEKFPQRTLIFYYDATAIHSNYAVDDKDFATIIQDTLRQAGWMVWPVYIGKPMNHFRKHAVINRGFDGLQHLQPYFNRGNNQDLLRALQLAEVYKNGKDKTGEKAIETTEDLLEHRTDFTDAWDTLYLGCELYPQSIYHSKTSSDF